MSLKRLILVFLGAALITAGGLVLWAFNTDLGQFRPSIETWLSETLERDTRFGELHVELGRSIHVSARDFHIANVPGAESPFFVFVEQLEGEVSLASLFDDSPILIERLEATGLEVNLAWDEEGRGNYMLAGADDAEPTDPVPDTPRVMVTTRDTRITNATLVLTRPERENRVEFQRLSLAEGADRMLALAFEGAINGDSMGFDGHAGPLDELVAAGAVRFDGEGHLGDLKLQGEADIDDLDNPNRPTVVLDVAGGNIRQVEAWLGLDPGPAADFNFALDAGTEENSWIIDLRGRIGEFTLDAYGDTSGLQDLKRVGLTVSAQGPNLAGVLRLLGMGQAPEEPFEARGRLVREGPRLILDDVSMSIGPTQFMLDGALSEFPHLSGGTLDLDVRGPDIAAFRDLFGLPGAADGAFALDLTLLPGDDLTDGIDLLSGRIETNLGIIEAEGRVTSDDRYVGSTLDIYVRGRNALETLGPLGLPGLEPAPFTLRADLEVQPKGVDFITASVTGIYETQLTASGLVGWKPLENETQLDLRFEGQDLARTLQPVGVKWPLGSDSYEITAGLRATAAGLRIDALQARVGQANLEADALVPLASDLAGLDVTLEAAGPDLSNIFLDTEAIDVPSENWALAGHVRRIDGRLTLENGRLQIADIQLAGSGEVPWPLREGEGSFELEGQGPDLSAAIPRVGSLELENLPFSLFAKASVSGGAWVFAPSHVGIGRSRLDFSGTVDRLPDFSDTNFDVKLAIPDLGTLGEWADTPLPSTKVGIDAHLLGSQTRLSLEDMVFYSGESVTRGDVSWDTAGAIPRLDVALESELLDLRGLFPETANTDEPEKSPPDDDGRLIPNADLPLSWLRAIDADADVTIGRLLTDRRILSDVHIDATLKDGMLVVERYRTKGIIGTIEAAGRIELLADGRADVELELLARDLMPEREDWQSADPDTLPRVNAIVEVRSAGASLRELAGRLNGRVRATASEGTLPGKGLGALESYFLEQIFSVLIPGMNTQQPTELLCTAINLTVEDGLVRTEPVASLRTDKILVLATGTLNLNDESMDLQFQTTPSKLLGASLTELVNPFVSIQGTLAQPKLVIDPTRTIVYGGAAAATAGLSVVAKGLFDRMRGASKPCEQLRTSLEAEAEAELSRR